MSVLQIVFSSLSTAVSLYSFICVIRILLSWFPGSQQSPLGNMLSTLCDPYMNWFRRFRFGSLPIDFSPILSLGVLSVLQTVFGRLAVFGRITLGMIFALLLQVVWSFVNFILLLLVILLAVRLIANVLNKDTFSQFWRSADMFLNPVVGRVVSLFKVKGGMTYRNELIVTFLVFLSGWLILRIGIGVLIQLLSALPF